MSTSTTKGGPRTAAGKAAVARNAIAHGLGAELAVLPGVESEADWQAHRAALVAALTPTGHLEEALAERAAHLLWRLRRVGRYETEQAALARDRAEDDVAAGYRAATADLSRPATHPRDLRAQLRDDQACLRLLEALPDQPADIPIAAAGAATILARLSRERGATTIDGFAWPGVPDGVRPADFPGWTAGLVRDAVASIAARLSLATHRLDPARLLADAVTHLRERVAATAAALDHAAAEVARLRRERVLPPPAALDRVIRYEAHLSRLFITALHELEALQARRAGFPAPLARLEVSGLPEHLALQNKLPAPGSPAPPAGSAPATEPGLQKKLPAPG